MPPSPTPSASAATTPASSSKNSPNPARHAQTTPATAGATRKQFRRLPAFHRNASSSFQLYLSTFRLTHLLPLRLSLYRQAFSHKSHPDAPDNERLEFLGDALLSSVIADMLFRLFPHRQEGFLTSTRAKIVRGETLQRIALELHLDRMMHLFGCPPPPATRTQDPRLKIYGNALEALIAAIYLDRGYRAAARFITSVIVRRHLDLNQLIQQETNFKSSLIEWAQKHKVQVAFQVEHCGYDHLRLPLFRSTVSLGSRPLGSGLGHSKKQSQQLAAQQAMRLLSSGHAMASHPL